MGNGIALVGIELAVGLEGEVVIGDGATTLQGQRFIEMHGLRCGDEGHTKNPASLKTRPGSQVSSLAGFIKRPQAEANRRVENCSVPHSLRPP